MTKIATKRWDLAEHIRDDADGPVAQFAAEQRTFNPKVVGSNPTGPTNFRSIYSE